MTLRELKKLVTQKESEHLDFKRSTGQRSDGAKALCAMLNGNGGFVLFGVLDDGTIKGQQVTDSTLKDISEELLRIEPPVFPETETVKVEEGKSVIAIRVPGGGGPYTYSGRPYSRQGPATVKMPQQRYERLLLERMHSSQRWENQRTLNHAVSHLDTGEIVRTVDEAIRRNRMDDPGTRDPLELLRGLALIDAQGAPLNAAVVLFSRSEYLLPDFPQCMLKLARFKGTDKTEFMDSRQEFGNAFELFKKAQRFFIDHLPVASHIPAHSFERVDEPLFPPEALREALANAICHRDYANAGGSISIGIYDDRLEISNTGSLPFDLTPEELFSPHASRPWNPLIAQVFYRRGIIEIWGRGTIKMRDLTVAAALPAPEIECSGGGVLVRFNLPRGKRFSSLYTSTTDSVSDSTRRSTSDSTSRSTSDSTSQQKTRATDLDMKVIALLKNGPLSTAEISRELGQKMISGQLKAVLQKLKKDNLISYTNPDKPQSRLQKYLLTDKGSHRAATDSPS